MKLSQNQYYGLDKEKPANLNQGSQYIAIDTQKLYIYGEDRKPINVGPADIGLISSSILGWQDYADSNTSQLNPISQLNISGGEVQITNNNNDTATDGNTNVNAETTVRGLNDLWNTSTNTFDFKDTGIEKNDLFFIRFHLNISANIIPQDFEVRIDFYDDIGGQGNYVFSLRKSGKTINESAGVFQEDFMYVEGYVGESILNGSGVAYLKGSSAFELEVIGHKINITKIAR